MCVLTLWGEIKGWGNGEEVQGIRGNKEGERGGEDRVDGGREGSSREGEWEIVDRKSVV